MSEPVHLLLVSGSTRAASTNTAVLRTALAVAPPGVEAVLYDGLLDLPAFTPDDDQANQPAVAHLHAAIADADAVVVSTPEYAGALPGSFKNLLDWTVGTGGLYEKPVAWIDVAAEGRGAGAAAELTTVLGYVSASVVEEACLRLPVSRDAVGEDGRVADHTIRGRIATAIGTLAAALGVP